MTKKEYRQAMMRINECCKEAKRKIRDEYSNDHKPKYKVGTEVREKYTDSVYEVKSVKLDDDGNYVYNLYDPYDGVSKTAFECDLKKNR